MMTLTCPTLGTTGSKWGDHSPSAARTESAQSFTGSSVTIPFVLAQRGDVKLRILDVSGRQCGFWSANRWSGEAGGVLDGRNDGGDRLPRACILRARDPGSEPHAALSNFGSRSWGCGVSPERRCI